jgi:hypothetical protein
MRLIHLTVPTIIGRLYLVMAIILIAGFTKLWFLSVLAFPIFVSVMGGIHIRKHTKLPYMKETDRVQTEQALHARHH